MAGDRKGGKRAKHSLPPSQLVSADEKIARLLGILATSNIQPRTKQVTLLRSVGFEVSEVAAMLGITENHVNVAAHHGRKRTTKKAGKRAPKGGSKAAGQGSRRPQK